MTVINLCRVMAKNCLLQCILIFKCQGRRAIASQPDKLHSGLALSSDPASEEFIWVFQ